MNQRFFLTVFSAFILSSCDIVTFLENPFAMPIYDKLEEFPLGMQDEGDAVYLLHFTTGLVTQNPPKNSGLQFSSIHHDGTVSTLQDLNIPAIGGNYIAGAVTATNNEAVAFAVATSGSQGLFTIFLTNGGPSQVVPLATGDREGGFDINPSLSLLRRDASRYWAYYSQAYRSAGSSFLPLFEIENGIAKLVADNVIWAHCNEAWCQHIRIEGSKLRLYATPATLDSYDEAVTDAAASGKGHNVGHDGNGEPNLVFGNTLYALSMTRPTLDVIKTLIPDTDRDVLLERLSDDERLTRSFPNGDRLMVEAREARCDSKPECMAVETWVTLKDPEDNELRSFPIHDY